MKSFLKGFLCVVLCGAVTQACLSSEEPDPEPADQTIEIPQELTLPKPHPNKCGCHTTLDCSILCGGNLICLPSPGGGEGTCVTAQAFEAARAMR